MKHLDILGQYLDYTYRYYEVSDRLSAEYERMKYLVLNETRGTPDPHPLECGVLLEKDNEVIAGTFLNMSVNPKVILILNIYVQEEHRRKGIHTTMHKFVDQIAVNFNKTSIFSNIHASNKIMVDYIMEKQEYQPFTYIVRRDVRQ